MYVVEAINDGSATLPPSWMLQPSGGNFRCSITTPSSEEADRTTELVGSSNSCALRSCSSSAIRNLSIRSSTPAIAYQALWPWRLCHEIINLIQEDQFRGLRDILPFAAGLCHNQSSSSSSISYGGTTSIPSLLSFQVLDPTTFSNWISSNMPLSRDDSLDLLEMTCTVQQLKFLISLLKDKKEELILLRCKYCGSPISQMKHVFSVTGTCGTAGNYVNSYGVNHQTVTVRTVDYDVLCVGQPETKESWFPGYSWQIAHCAICFEHLGWKYQRVDKTDKNDDDEDNRPDRPDTFWGFSSVTTDEHVQPRRL
jgi:cereblon